MSRLYCDDPFATIFLKERYGVHFYCENSENNTKERCYYDRWMMDFANKRRAFVLTEWEQISNLHADTGIQILNAIPVDEKDALRLLKLWPEEER